MEHNHDATCSCCYVVATCQTMECTLAVVVACMSIARTEQISWSGNGSVIM